MKLSDLEFQELRRLIQKLCGIWLGEDKMYLIRTRFEPVLHKHKLVSYSELLLRAKTGNALRLQEELVEAITTNETSFNRDSHPFEELRRAILPELIQLRFDRQRAAGLPFGKLRLWSAAASTGQEAYSLGIAILSFIDFQTRDGAQKFMVGPDNFYILGTDISNDALAIAKSGKYYGWELERGLSPEAKQCYFDEKGGVHEIKPALRNFIEFQRLNIVQPWLDPSLFDMILCRNLLTLLCMNIKQKIRSIPPKIYS